jgi:hypothetical protein
VNDPVAWVTDWFCVGPTLLLASWGVFRAFHHRASLYAIRDARRARLREGPLAEGPAVLSGTVAYARDVDFAVRVTVEQHAYPGFTPNTRYWRQDRRRVEARPFYLVTEGGRVRVEPPYEPVVLDAEFGPPEDVDGERRIRRATLSEGMPLYVEGLLRRGEDREIEPRGGYRDGDRTGWVLVPSEGRMVLSAGSPEERWRRQEALALGWAIRWPTVLAAAVALLATSPFLLRQLAGERCRVLSDGTRLSCPSGLHPVGDGLFFRVYGSGVEEVVRVPFAPWASAAAPEAGMSLGLLLVAALAAGFAVLFTLLHQPMSRSAPRFLSDEEELPAPEGEGEGDPGAEAAARLERRGRRDHDGP